MPRTNKRTTLDLIVVRASALDRRRGRVLAGGLAIPCALGRSGLVRRKREGDGGTPLGRFALLGCLFRPDRGPRPTTRLPARPHRPSDGWCDDPEDRRYNRPVRLPYPGRHERMWRQDRLYDAVVDIAANRGPVARGRGSAIFLHVAGPGLPPTEGCVAIAPAAMRRLLPRLGPNTRIAIIG